MSVLFLLCCEKLFFNKRDFTNSFLFFQALKIKMIDFKFILKIIENSYLILYIEIILITHVKNN